MFTSLKGQIVRNQRNVNACDYLYQKKYKYDVIEIRVCLLNFYFYINASKLFFLTSKYSLYPV